MKLTQLVGISLLAFSFNLWAEEGAPSVGTPAYPGGVVGTVPTAPLPPPVAPATDVGGVIGTVPTAPMPAVPTLTCSNGQKPKCMSKITAPVCPDTPPGVGGIIGEVGRISSCGNGYASSCSTGTPECITAPKPVVHPTCSNGAIPICVPRATTPQCTGSRNHAMCGTVPATCGNGPQCPPAAN